MKKILSILFVAWIIWTYLFFWGNWKINNNKSLEHKNINVENLKEAYFAGWCFWCMEGIFEAQPWVSEAIVWYVGWDKKTASYEQVSTWLTKHREWIKVIYDPKIISYKKLAELYWTQIDPTDDWWQFADRWLQYTTAMFYTNDEQKKILEESKKALEDSKKFDKKIATKILPFKTFFPAEEHHQNYYKKHSIRYKLYKKWSGREWFIENHWENRIKQLEKTSFKKSNSNKNWYQNYSEDLVKNAWDKNKVLFFHADWCSTCNAFEKKVLSEKIPNNILILKVNYDTNIKLKRKYNIVTQTSFVLIDKNGNLKKRWIWARDINDIINKIWDTSLSAKTYTKEELKKRLTPLQYKVTQEWGTEPPFHNKYWNNHKEWIYVDIIDGTPLFSSTDKFNSWTGWPSFTKPIDDNFTKEKTDNSLFMTRTEIKSKDSHLWHVFNDWPSDKWGLRYCINSAALNFIPKEKLKGTKYEKYLKLFK